MLYSVADVVRDDVNNLCKTVFYFTSERKKTKRRPTTPLSVHKRNNDITTLSYYYIIINIIITDLRSRLGTVPTRVLLRRRSDANLAGRAYRIVTTTDVRRVRYRRRRRQRRFRRDSNVRRSSSCRGGR